MTEITVAGLLLVAVFATATYWRIAYVRDQSRRRLESPEILPAPTETWESRGDAVFIRGHFWAPWVLAIVVGVTLAILVKWPWLFVVSLSFIVGLLGMQIANARLTRAHLLIEEQLADTVDLMVATLRAGAGVMRAMEFAARETRPPLKPQFDEVLGRIRLGDNPQTTIHGLERRVPLETFRLFAAAMSVHWETGGSLTPALAVVGRVIRDRIEIQRRIRALSMQAFASTFAVLGVTYAIALIMWRGNPVGVAQFLSTSIGQGMVAAVMMLQALGLVWSAKLSRLKY